MMDHVVVRVKDFDRSRRFYVAALAPLGYKVAREFPGWAGFMRGEKADFWIATETPVTTGLHVAFACAERGPVDAFHAAAMKTGGRDNGAPGLRANYHPNYYGAFVLDPDGNNIEAVCHNPKG